MNEIFENIVSEICLKNPLHGKKLRKNFKKADEKFFQEAKVFMDKYLLLLHSEGRNLNYAIDCYLQMIGDINFETVQFQTTGEYSSTSFEEVNKRVYNNPAIMEYYMHGLLMSQFLWKHHYEVLLYFREIIKKHSSSIESYLEVGGGHGLYISEAKAVKKDKGDFVVLDISESSLEIAKKLIGDDKVNYVLKDIFEYHPEKKYDFITMGEVLEHVEDPVKLLQGLSKLLTDNGRLFITTPTNAPTIDHIYLFRNAEEIRQVIVKADFEVEDEFCVYSEDLPPEIAEKFKISMMYAACLKKK